MKTKEKIKQLEKEFIDLPDTFDNKEETDETSLKAMNLMYSIINLQRLRIEELEEDNSTLVDKVERLE